MLCINVIVVIYLNVRSAVAKDEHFEERKKSKYMLL